MAKQVGVLSEDVKMYIELLTQRRYYALNDRIINVLLKGATDLNATMHQPAKPTTFSDAEISELIEQEKEVKCFIVGKGRTRAGGSFFPYLIEGIINIIVHSLLYNQEGYQILNNRS